MLFDLLKPIMKEKKPNILEHKSVLVYGEQWYKYVLNLLLFLPKNCMSELLRKEGVLHVFSFKRLSPAFFRYCGFERVEVVYVDERNRKIVDKILKKIYEDSLTGPVPRRVAVLGADEDFFTSSALWKILSDKTAMLMGTRKCPGSYITKFCILVGAKDAPEDVIPLFEASVKA